MSDRTRREVVLTSDRESGGWNASVPSLPGCFSQGETIDEALANVQDAMEVWLSSSREHGDPIPDEDYSTRVVVIDEPAAAPSEAA